MDNIGYLSLSMAAMMERATDVTANNIANANTDGFRAAKVSFDQMVTDSGDWDDLSEMAYSLDRGTYNDMTAGPVLFTGGNLDLALQGEAYFAFRRQDGDIAFGRNGSFTLTAEGDLATAAGDLVLDAGGNAVNIPPDAGSLAIAGDGTISTEAGVVLGQIGAFSAPDIAQWQPLDGTMFAPREGNPALTLSLDATISQGYVEKSNVEPVLQMTQLISRQRAYERAMSMAESANDLRSETLQRLGRSS
ncbi:flagellar hook-basal body complex protein [Paracoccus ravus]|uniref:flagellar hook-basal body complex protein n=1 Tax=Paracoccus ravus TaxID=2447760 RepID=UPI00106EA99A|nr:flagellar hook-basal body complex protein [Paracoccus ravus]